ncbi:unnamed protein product, partial [Prorocentrum cordatum]
MEYEGYSDMVRKVADHLDLPLSDEVRRCAASHDPSRRGGLGTSARGPRSDQRCLSSGTSSPATTRIGSGAGLARRLLRPSAVRRGWWAVWRRPRTRLTTRRTGWRGTG